MYNILYGMEKLLECVCVYISLNYKKSICYFCELQYKTTEQYTDKKYNNNWDYNKKPIMMSW